VTILPRIRCALSSWTRQLVTSPSGTTSSGPFTHHRCLTYPSVPVAPVLRRHRLTCPRRPAFTAGHQARYPAGYTRNDLAEGPGHHAPRLPASFRPPAFASWASCSRQGVEPSSRSAYHHQRWRTRTGFPRSPRMRYSRVGCPLDPGGDGVHTVIEESSTAVCRLSAASPFVSPVLSSRPEELP
jgi:hypothetical protein